MTQSVKTRKASTEVIKRANVNWDRVLQAASMILAGGTRRGVADALGCSPRTITRWVGQEWWPDAMEEASNYGMTSFIYQARKVIAEALQDGDVRTARWVLEHGDRQFRPDSLGPNPGVETAAVTLKELSEDELRALAATPMIEVDYEPVATAESEEGTGPPPPARLHEVDVPSVQDELAPPQDDRGPGSR